MGSNLQITESIEKYIEHDTDQALEHDVELSIEKDIVQDTNHDTHQEDEQRIKPKNKESIQILSNKIDQNLVVSKQESHECFLCDDKFFTKSQLKDHLDRHINSGCYGKMLFNCENCNMELPNKNTLNDHIKVCNKEKDIEHDVHIGHDIEQAIEKDIEHINMSNNDIEKYREHY